MTVLSKRTMADQVADLLRQRILSGVLPAGSPIRQEHLAAEFGISRIPLREALKQLAAEGFVTIASHKGAMVAQMSIAEIEELFELRLRLETWMLGLALPRLTEDDFAALDQLIAEQRAPDSLPRWGELNWRFHEIMYRPADRPLTLKMLRRIHDNIDRYLRLEVSLSAGRDRAFQEHETLLDHCRKREVDPALDLLERHIQQTAQSLIANLRRQEKRAAAD